MATATATAVAHTVQGLEEEGGATAHQLPTIDDGDPAHQQHKSYKQCCGSGMFIPDPNFSIPDPGSEFFPSRIPNPKFPSRIPGLGSRIRIKEFKYFDPKNCFLALGNKILVVHPGSRIRNLDFFTHPGSPIPDPGVKKALDLGSNTGYKQWRQELKLRQWQQQQQRKATTAAMTMPTTGNSQARQQSKGTAKGNDNAKGRSKGNIYSNQALKTNL
jgi:hypothetical protein